MKISNSRCEFIYSRINQPDKHQEAMNRLLVRLDNEGMEVVHITTTCSMYDLVSGVFFVSKDGKKIATPVAATEKKTKLVRKTHQIEENVVAAKEEPLVLKGE